MRVRIVVRGLSRPPRVFLSGRFNRLRDEQRELAAVLKNFGSFLQFLSRASSRTTSSAFLATACWLALAGRAGIAVLKSRFVSYFQSRASPAALSVVAKGVTFSSVTDPHHGRRITALLLCSLVRILARSSRHCRVEKSLCFIFPFARFIRAMYSPFHWSRITNHGPLLS